MATVNVHFKLKDSHSDKSTLIYLKVYFNKKRFVYSTREKINPENWNKETQRVIIPRGDKVRKEQYKAINHTLEDLKGKVEEVFTNCTYNKITPTPDYLKKELDKEFKPETQETPTNLFDFIEQIIQESKSGNRTTRKGKQLSPYTIKGYVTTLNHLRGFKKATHKKIDFDTINMRFYKDFLKYFNDQERSPNSIGKNIKNLKVFLKEATKRGLNTNLIYQDEDFVTLNEETDQIYLNETELLKIYNKDFTKNPRLERVRDLFIIGCYTGLRFADLAQLRQENIIKDGTQIKITQQKTGDTVYIPLHWRVGEILNKYEGIPPRAISNQKMNNYLKEMGEDAGITEEVIQTQLKGGLRVDVKRKKHELITVHTARRSFATNMYNQGIPSISIMKITGHRTEKSFLKYIRVTQEEVADRLMEHPFFQPKSNLKVI